MVQVQTWADADNDLEEAELAVTEAVERLESAGIQMLKDDSDDINVEAYQQAQQVFLDALEVRQACRQLAYDLYATE